MKKDKPTTFEYIANSGAFSGIGINTGDILTFEDAPPREGDLTLVVGREPGEEQLVMLLGRGFMDSPIVCDRFTTYPHAVEIPKAAITKRACEFMGRMTDKRAAGKLTTVACAATL